MKLKSNIIIAVFCILTTSCNENVEQQPDKPLINSQLIKTYNDMALENAIISQHTLYPYQFVKNGAALNELGKRDLDVLIKHFIKEPGFLNIRKSDTPPDLYASRVELVYQKLQKAGLNMDKINISDEMPGGSGIASETILVILEKEDETTSSSTGTSKIKI
jgi:hypothetical protein